LEDALVTVWASGLARQAARVSGSTGRLIGPESCEAVTLAGVAHGRSLTALDLLEAHDAMNEVTRAVAQFFLSVDLLVTPALAEPPAPLGRFDYDDPSYGVTDWLATITTYAPMMAIFNVSGNPAMVLPIGRPANGPPASVQLVAPYGREDILFRAAAQLQHDSPLDGCLPAIHAAAGNAPEVRPHTPRGTANRLTGS
jgi:amidase